MGWLVWGHGDGLYSILGGYDRLSGARLVGSDRVGGLSRSFLNHDLYGSDRAGAMMALFPQADAASYGLFTRPEFCRFWFLVVLRLY